jgi:predicted phage gp36 major capsid-like protein
MTDHVTLMREHAAQLRAQADRYDRAADMIDCETPTTKNGTKPKREGRQETRPTRAGRKAGQSRTAVAEYFAKHPKATAREVGAALKMSPAAAGYHLTQLRK